MVHRIKSSQQIYFCARFMFGNRMYDHKCGINMFKVVECRTHRSVPSFVLHQARASHWVTIGHRRTVSRQHSTRSRCQLVSPRTRTNAGVSHLCFSGVNAYNHLPQATHDLGLAPLKACVLEWLLGNACRTVVCDTCFGNVL